MGAIWKSGSRRFHQAGHVLPELTQRIFPKGVVSAVEHHVPVGRRDYRHAAECEVAAQLVERRGGSCTPKRRHCTCRLAGELPPVHARSVEYAVKQREQRTVWGETPRRLCTYYPFVKTCHLSLEELVELAINLDLALHEGIDDEMPSMNDVLYRAQRAQVLQWIASCDNHVSLLPHLD